MGLWTSFETRIFQCQLYSTSRQKTSKPWEPTGYSSVWESTCWMLIHGASTRKQDGQQLFLPFEHPSIHKYRASLHFKLVSFDEGANMLMLKTTLNPSARSGTPCVSACSSSLTMWWHHHTQHTNLSQKAKTCLSWLTKAHKQLN